VYQGGAPDYVALGDPQAAPLRRGRGKIRDTRRVADEGGRDEIGERAHRRERTIDLLPLQGEPRVGLGRKRLLPSRGLASARQDLPRIVGEATSDLWVERASSALADNGSRVLHSAEEVLDGGVSGHIGDPDGQRDLVPPGASERALAVPAIRESEEEPSHRVRQTEHWAAMWGLLLLAAFGNRRAIWIARTGAELSGSGSARTTPASISRCEP
jgi:hypothetical protein